MKKFISIFLLLVICVFSLTTLAIAKETDSERDRVQAPRNSPDCFALDIVFVIDQSSSMGGDSLMKPNDPLGFRFKSPQYALNWLASNRISRLSQCPDVVHRIGVVSFGTTARTDLELTQIDSSSQQEWADHSPGILSKIVGDNMKKTDTYAGISLASEMLENSQPLGELPRKRALILVTDGQPCTEEMGGNCSDTTADPTVSQSEYLAIMEDFVSNQLSFSPAVIKRDEAIEKSASEFGGADKIPSEVINQIISDNPVSNEEFFQSVYFYVLATNDATKYSDLVGDSFDRMSLEHGGNVFAIEQNLIELPKLFNSILSTMAGVTPSLLKCGDIAVNPYLSGVVLDIYKAAEGLEVQINYNGKSLNRGNGDEVFFGLDDYTSFGAIEHYQFKNPPAGLWNISCSDSNGAEVSFLPFNAFAQLQSPNSVIPQYTLNEELSDPSHPNYLNYKVMSQGDGTPLSLDPMYPLKITATINSPSGNISKFVLKYVDDGSWISEQPIPVNEPGEYEINVLGIAPCVSAPGGTSTNCPKGELTIVKNETDVYVVGPVETFNMNVISPEKKIPVHGELIPGCLPIEPIIVQVQLTDVHGSPLAISKVANPDIPPALYVDILSGEKTQSLVLRPSEIDPTMFIGIAEEFTALGSYNMTVDARDSYDYKHYTPEYKVITYIFNREDTLFRTPIVFRSVLSALLLLLLGYFIYVIWLKTFPAKGYIEFSRYNPDDQDTLTTQIGVGKGLRTFSLRGKKIPTYLQGNFQKIVVKNMPALGRSPSRRAVLEVDFNGTSRKLIDGQPSTIQGWNVIYKLGADAGYKDHFVISAISVSILCLGIIALAFIVPGCGY